jgi:hypothetical protein
VLFSFAQGSGVVFLVGDCKSKNNALYTEQ